MISSLLVPEQLDSPFLISLNFKLIRFNKIQWLLNMNKSSLTYCSDLFTHRDYLIKFNK